MSSDNGIYILKTKDQYRVAHLRAIDYVTWSMIDESPMVYKPIDEIVNNIENTVEIVKIIKPIYNFKAGE